MAIKQSRYITVDTTVKKDMAIRTTELDKVKDDPFVRKSEVQQTVNNSTLPVSSRAVKSSLNEKRDLDDNVFNGQMTIKSDNDEQGAGILLQESDGTVRGKVAATDQGLQLTQHPKEGGSQTFTFPSEGGEVALRDNSVSALPGVPAHMGACVIRRTDNTKGWEFIDNSTHYPINFESVQDRGSEIEIMNKSLPVGSYIVGADETFAKMGVIAGVSGGGGRSYITMSAPCSFTINLNSGASLGWSNTSLFPSGVFNVSVSGGGAIIVEHPPLSTRRTPIMQYSPASRGDEDFSIYRVNTSGNTTTFYLLQDTVAELQHTGNNVFSVISSNSVEYSCEYSSETGILRVYHDSLARNSIPFLSTSGEDHVLRASVQGYTVNYVDIKLNKDDLTTFPVLPRTLNIHLNRGRWAVVPEKSMQGVVNVDLGHVQVNASNVVSTSGNLWIMSINSERR